MASIFTKIINKEIPCYKIAENDQFLAFLDINPLVKGHTLLIPKIEVDYYFDLDDNTLASMAVYSKKIAIALKKAVPCLRIGTTIIGLEVPHAHLHLIPLQSMYDMDFSRPKLKLSPEEFLEIANNISKYL